MKKRGLMRRVTIQLYDGSGKFLQSLSSPALGQLLNEALRFVKTTDTILLIVVSRAKVFCFVLMKSLLLPKTPIAILFTIF